MVGEDRLKPIQRNLAGLGNRHYLLKVLSHLRLKFVVRILYENFSLPFHDFCDSYSFRDGPELALFVPLRSWGLAVRSIRLLFHLRIARACVV